MLKPTRFGVQGVGGLKFGAYGGCRVQRLRLSAVYNLSLKILRL